MTDIQQAQPKRGNPFTPEMRAKAAETRAANKAKKLARAERQAAKPAAAPEYKVAAPEFAGLTATECCDGCNETKCVISGKPYCAHPLKGGLHAIQKTQPDTMKRFNRAVSTLRGASLNPDKMR